MTAHARPMRLLTLLTLLALTAGARPATAQAPAPAGLTALTQYDSSDGHYVNLVWTASAAAPTCSVERSTDGVNYTVIGSAAAYISPGAQSGYGDYRDYGLPPSTTYFYRVRAYTGTGGATQYSAYSNVVTVTTLGNPPPVPTNFTAVTTPAVDGAVSLSWSPSAEATYYQVDIFAGDGTTGYYYCDPPAGGGQVNVTLTGLTDGDQYAFDVAAVNNPSMQGQGVQSAFAGPIYATPHAPLAPPALLSSDAPPPAWAMDVVPTDEPDADGEGPSSSEGVSLPAGVKENTPGADIKVYNPLGPDVSYERMYRSTRALANYGSPGLSPGWVDNYDLTVTVRAGGTYTLTYPNGA